MLESPLMKKMSCWKGYSPQGKKKSPSGKTTSSGKTKMVNNCVKDQLWLLKYIKCTAKKEKL